MRLFFALPLPARIQRTLAALQTDLGEARWVPATQLHLTLRFLGEVDGAQTARIIAQVETDRAAAPWPKVRIALRGVGLFGAIPRPRVLWTTVEPPAPVNAIAAALERSVIAAGLPAETRPFAAHVTLARFRRTDRARLEAFLRQEATFSTDPFDVPEVILYASTLASSGAVHVPQHRFSL